MQDREFTTGYSKKLRIILTFKIVCLYLMFNFIMFERIKCYEKG